MRATADGNAPDMLLVEPKGLSVMVKSLESKVGRHGLQFPRRTFLAAAGAAGTALAIGGRAGAETTSIDKAPSLALSGTRTVGQSIGGGNISNNTTPADRYAVLDDLRAFWVRANWYPNVYYNSGAPSPSAADSAVLFALERNKNIHAYFEMYHDYTAPPRTYDVWYSIGLAFATRFRPDSPFLQSNGFTGRGIESWAAINEPDGPRAEGIAPDDYRNMLQGFADGIHAVDPDARVYPGGYLSANRDQEYTAHGRLPAIAPLLNNGTLAGIDLHNYNDVSFSPIHDRYSRTAQHDFDAMKIASGITSDIELLVTEHNYKDASVNQGYDNSWAQRYFLPHLWDQIGVVGNNGTPVTRFAMYWSLFREGPSYLYGTNSITPISYRVTGSVYKRILTVVHDMIITLADPKGRGEYVLEGGGKKVWVFQNIHPTWSSIYGDAYTVTNIPSTATTLEIWNHTGVLSTVPTNGNSSVTVDTPPGQTYVILAPR